MSDGDFEDLFYVLLPDNQVETLSLDELDEAFQAERIAETTLVCRVGGTKWLALAELASLDDEPEPVPSRRTSEPSAPVYFAPMTPPAAYVPPVSRVPDSMAPLTADLSRFALDDDDLDLDALALRPKRRALWVVTGLASLGLAGIAALFVAGGVAASVPGADHTAAMLKLPAAAALPTPVEAQPTPAPPSPDPAAPAAAVSPTETAPTASPPEKERFSEDMKRALLEADAKPAAKKAVASAKKRGHLRKAKPVRAKGKRKGKGNAYDPLNGNL